MTYCPNINELAAFSVGKPTLQKWDSIADHVSSCAHCSRKLTEFSHEEDSVVLRLREYVNSKSIEFQFAVNSGRAGELAGAASPKGSSLRGTDRSDLETNKDLTSPIAKRMVHSVGHYQLLELVGEGGMGLVYKAFDTHLGRLVAVKMISAGAHASSQAVARFLREGKAVARLKHPGVVQVYEFNIHDGLPFMVMEFMDEGSLSQRLASWTPSFEEAARCVRQIADAVQAANALNILHRDLKPSNVLLGAGATPKLTDFGLAKLLDDEGGNTVSEDILGTASYMAPEQANGRLEDIGPATDVYGLGAILYELLTKRPPFKEGNRLKTLEAVRTSSALPPSQFNADIPPELEAVCLKCLSKTPAKRYPTAAHLANELEAWLAGNRTKVRPVPRWRSRLRKHWISLATATVLLILTLAALIIAYYWNSDRPIDAIEKQLRQGKPVTIIGMAGMPKWSRWSSGERHVNSFLMPDGVFTIQSQQLCLLELVRDPQVLHYRIEADVRHNLSDQTECRIGIYFAHQENLTPQGLVHSYDDLAYNDVDDPLVSFRRATKGLSPERKATFTPPQGNEMSISHRFLTDWREPPSWDVRAGGQTVAFFPTPTRPVWRSLIIDVSPSTIQTSCVGLGKVRLDVPVLERQAREMLKYRHDINPKDQLHGKFSAHFRPRGSFGLFVEAGSASFRNVRLRPLPERSI